jgi:hypothetical protein
MFEKILDYFSNLAEKNNRGFIFNLKEEDYCKNYLLFLFMIGDRDINNFSSNETIQSYYNYLMN